MDERLEKRDENYTRKVAKDAEHPREALELPNLERYLYTVAARILSRGVSQGDFSSQIGISQGNLSDKLNRKGNSFTLEDLAYLSHHLGQSPGDFLNRLDFGKEHGERFTAMLGEARDLGLLDLLLSAYEDDALEDIAEQVAAAEVRAKKRAARNAGSRKKKSPRSKKSRKIS